MKKQVQKLCVTAVMLALATVLSELLPHFEMPLGGSISPVSMLPIVMLPVMYGTVWGIGSAFVYSIIQLLFGLSEGILSWGLSPAYTAGMIIFDYVLAYTVLGVAGIFAKKGIVGIGLGVAAACFLRFVCHFISGCIFCASWSAWDNVYLYSICYNGAYMLPELIITTIAAVLVFNVPYIKSLTRKA